MMGKSSGGSERPVTAEEKRLWDTQADNLDAMTALAQDQYDLGVEDREYYEKVFREGSDTEAKTAIAKLKSQITGEEVSADEISSVNIDSLLRDTILSATPEFQKLANDVVSTSNELTTKYADNVTGISQSFSKGIQDLTKNYSNELQTIKDQTGTINQDILSRETGAATAGISSAFEEARKQMQGSLAQRGLSGSGVEQQVMADMYNQEAMNKAGAMSQARMSALGQSEAVRQQQMGIAGAQLQANTSGLTTGYQTEMGALGNVYGVQSANLQQGLQTTNAGMLQGIAGLTQAAQAGTGVYAGSQNFLAQAGSTAGQAASIAGQSAGQIGSLNQQYAEMQAAQDNAAMAGIGSLAGTLGGAYMTGGASVAASQAKNGQQVTGLFSDKRLKTNIEFKEVVNGYNIYTWDWIEGFDGGYNEGVIAQEVLEINPDAVIMDESGYYKVNYSKLGV
jgi:hypothetical protein